MLQRVNYSPTQSITRLSPIPNRGDGGLVNINECDDLQQHRNNNNTISSSYPSTVAAIVPLYANSTNNNHSYGGGGCSLSVIVRNEATYKTTTTNPPQMMTSSPEVVVYGGINRGGTAAAAAAAAVASSSPSVPAIKMELKPTVKTTKYQQRSSSAVPAPAFNASSQQLSKITPIPTSYTPGPLLNNTHSVYALYPPPPPSSSSRRVCGGDGGSSWYYVVRKDSAPQAHVQNAKTTTAVNDQRLEYELPPPPTSFHQIEYDQTKPLDLSSVCNNNIARSRTPPPLIVVPPAADSHFFNGNDDTRNRQTTTVAVAAAADKTYETATRRVNAKRSDGDYFKEMAEVSSDCFTTRQPLTVPCNNGSAAVATTISSVIDPATEETVTVSKPPDLTISAVSAISGDGSTTVKSASSSIVVGSTDSSTRSLSWDLSPTTRDSSPSTPPPILTPATTYCAENVFNGMKATATATTAASTTATTRHHKLKKAWLQRHVWTEDLKEAGVSVDQNVSGSSSLDDTPPVLQCEITKNRKKSNATANDGNNGGGGNNSTSVQQQKRKQQSVNGGGGGGNKRKRKKGSTTAAEDKKAVGNATKKGEKTDLSVKTPKKRGRKPKVDIYAPVKVDKADECLTFFQNSSCLTGCGMNINKCRECRLYDKKTNGNKKKKEVDNIFCRFYAFRRLLRKENVILNAGFSDPYKYCESVCMYIYIYKTLILCVYTTHNYRELP